MPPIDMETFANIFGGSVDFLRKFFPPQPTAIDFLAVSDDDGRIVVTPARPDIAIALVNPAGTIVSVVPHLVIPRIDSPLSAVIDEFEYLINRPDVSELELQKFINAHPPLVMGLDYDAVFPQVALERRDDGPLIPDFLLKLLDKAEVDLLDLKLPNAKMTSGGKNRLRFSQVVQNGIAQL